MQNYRSYDTWQLLNIELVYHYCKLSLSTSKEIRTMPQCCLITTSLKLGESNPKSQFEEATSKPLYRIIVKLTAQLGRCHNKRKCAQTLDLRCGSWRIVAGTRE